MGLTGFNRARREAQSKAEHYQAVETDIETVENIDPPVDSGDVGGGTAGTEVAQPASEDVTAADMEVTDEPAAEGKQTKKAKAK